MAKPIPEEDLQAIEAAVGTQPDGATLEQIEGALTQTMPRRTLQHRLKYLVTRERLAMSGDRRWAKYRIKTTGEQPPARDATARQQGDMFVQLSKPGAEVLRLVSKPVSARKPAGYIREFLDGYRPNRTHYLTAAEKARLHELGRTGDNAQAAGTYAQQIMNRLMIDLAWNSSRLEGNTYSLLDTKRLIEFGEEAEGKATTDAQMILNHKAAIEFLVQSANEIGFNRHTILNLHALLADNLLDDPTAPGRLRREPIGIGRSVYHPLEVPQLIEECFDQLLATAAAIDDPFEQAFFIMVQLPYLQPFIDVNKRVSRLAANIPLIKNNLAPLSFVAVPDATYTQGILGVYELNRIELIKDVFLWSYERSSARYAALRQSLGEPDAFRLRHRADLKQVIADIIRGAMDQKRAGAHIAARAAADLPEQDRARFIETAETDLLGLHEGNFARYQIRPSEFAAWRDIWEKPTARKNSKPGKH